MHNTTDLINFIKKPGHNTKIQKFDQKVMYIFLITSRLFLF